ncbi:hypothetical protein BDQ17DRAFT_1258183, partial [Cyathus striatus]
KCLTTSTNSNGSPLIIQTCTGASSQKFTFSGGRLTLFGGSMCLDVVNGQNVNGVKLQI